MEYFWLNGSFNVKPENDEERNALAVLLEALKPAEQQGSTTNTGAIESKAG